MAAALDPKQVIAFEELLMSQVVQQKPLTRLLVEKIFIDRHHHEDKPDSHMGEDSLALRKEVVMIG